MMRGWTLCLVLVGGVLAAAVAGAAPPPFTNPPELASVGGQLTGTLTVAPGDVVVHGKRVTTTLYNGAYMPPLLRVQPGDKSGCSSPTPAARATNIHYHGFAGDAARQAATTSSSTSGPATTFQYDFPIPPDHTPGLYWYHPHLHPDVNPQIAGGLSGGIIIGDILAPFPELAGITERVMLLKDLKIRQGARCSIPTRPVRRSAPSTASSSRGSTSRRASSSSGASGTSARTSSTG